MFLALALAACDTGRPAASPYLMASRAEFTRSASWDEESDIAAAARDFLFSQTELYLSGASPAAGGPMAEILALMGREDLITAAQTGAPPARCSVRPPEPVSHVRRAAQDAAAIILIEDGSQPRHRAFLVPLLSGLVEDGFTVYAADALSAGAGRAAFPGIPLITEGVLARDPVYGRVLRQVKAQGLMIVEGSSGWSPPSEIARLTPEERAARQVDMLGERLATEAFSGAEPARVLLHLSRHPGDNALARLEARLEGASGRAPLTVQMSDCEPPGSPRSVLPAEDASGEGAPDIRIGEPVAGFRNGRPDWRRQLGDREVTLPAAFRGLDAPVIVEVRREAETALAVPEDRLLLLPGESLPLMLPPGRYRAEAWTRDGPVGEPVPLTVR
ncbi:hypothetical protein [Hyphomonas sp.]|uniref:hypothetical protein n=1 Tax=Hyphomonas sp. TaxID=87 RepID=UPI00391D529F